MDEDNREVIYAVHEHDLIEFLKNKKLYELIINKKIKCIICGKTITLENFGGVYFKKGKALVVCDSIECISKFGVR